MKKHIFGRKLGRDTEERKALFKSLMSALILNERIQTTQAKAKAIKPEIEKLVTKAKSLESGARIVLEKSLSKKAFDKMVKEIGPRFKTREGGYTRIVRLGERFGDNSPLVLMEWVEIPEVVVNQIKKEKKLKVAKPSSAKALEGQGKKEVKKVKSVVKKVSKTKK